MINKQPTGVPPRLAGEDSVPSDLYPEAAFERIKFRKKK